MATVDEVVLLPGADALLAPEWVPWDQRLQPGDLSPGDLLPSDPADPRLVPAYVLSDDPAVEAVAFELGLGRVRVLSRDARLDTAERWYLGDTGPDAPMARQAPSPCGTCGFYLPLAGSLQAGFGVCGNDITDTDGKVVQRRVRVWRALGGRRRHPLTGRADRRSDLDRRAVRRPLSRPRDRAGRWLVRC